jgi:hypothetical protein
MVDKDPNKVITSYASALLLELLPLLLVSRDQTKGYALHHSVD